MGQSHFDQALPDPTERNSLQSVAFVVCLRVLALENTLAIAVLAGIVVTYGGRLLHYIWLTIIKGLSQ